jgi:phage portal protein BeeE
MRDRHASKLARRNCQPNLKKLTQQEEKVIIKYILNLNLYGFPPIYLAVRDIANRLLAVRGTS